MRPSSYLKPTFRDVTTGPFWRWQWLLIGCSVVSLGGVAMFIWFAFMSAPDTLGIPYAVGGVSLVAVALIAIITAIWRQAYRRTAWQRYSNEVGGSYRFDTRPTDQAFVFWRGAYQQVSDRIDNPSLLPFTSLGNYSYAYSLPYDHTELPLVPRKVSFFVLPLPRHLPHIILDSTHNNFLRRYSEYGLEIKNFQRLELEGDFIKHFSLYVPAGYETDALYVFSPDVMNILVQYAADYDIEIIDDTLYLFKPGWLTITDTATLQRLTAVGSAILAALDKNATRYADTAIDDPAADVVAPRGRRLVRRTVPIVIILLLIWLAGMLYG